MAIFKLSYHAVIRAQQRDIKLKHICAVWNHADLTVSACEDVRELRISCEKLKLLKIARSTGVVIDHLQGLVLLVSSDDVIVTLYYDVNPLRYREAA